MVSTMSNPYTFSNSNTNNPSAIFDTDKRALKVNGDLEVDGKIYLTGHVELEERLNTIEKMLCIPTRNIVMEEKYPELRRLYEEYMLELDKYTVWETLKSQDNE
jgi:hypothetical protein